MILIINLRLPALFCSLFSLEELIFRRISLTAVQLLTRAALLFWVLLFSKGQVIKTEKNFAVAPSAKGNRPPESGQGENERNEWQHYLLKRDGRRAKDVRHERQSEKKEAEG